MKRKNQKQVEDKLNFFLTLLKIFKITVRPQNSHTYPNSHALFCATKIWLFGYAKDIRRKRSLTFFKSSNKSFFITFEKLC